MNNRGTAAICNRPSGSDGPLLADMASYPRLLELLIKIRRKDSWGFFQAPVSPEDVRVEGGPVGLPGLLLGIPRHLHLNATPV